MRLLDNFGRHSIKFAACETSTSDQIVLYICTEKVSLSVYGACTGAHACSDCLNVTYYEGHELSCKLSKSCACDLIKDIDIRIVL